MNTARLFTICYLRFNTTAKIEPIDVDADNVPDIQYRTLILLLLPHLFIFLSLNGFNVEQLSANKIFAWILWFDLRYKY